MSHAVKYAPSIARILICQGVPDFFRQVQVVSAHQLVQIYISNNADVMEGRKTGMGEAVERNDGKGN